MTEWLCHSALERRHDGPLPSFAALPHDYASPWPDQLMNRRRWAWRDVRRIGHQLVQASHAAREHPATHDIHEWRRLRRELAFAVRCWNSYRDWARAAQADVTGTRRSATPRPDP